MSISFEDIKIFMAVPALIISLVSLYFTRVNWIQSNRPIVTAFVMENSSGNMAATFNLVIANTGNRPAVRVQMHAKPEEIKKLLEPNASREKAQMIESNFLKSSEIPLLKNGEELVTSFGAFSKNSNEDAWLRYGSEIEIKIKYQDLQGRKFEEIQPIKVYARKGFGGGVWNDAKS
jgi:hypothetical protein